MPAYYDYPQAPGDYQDAVTKGGNIYEEVEKERNGYVCGVPLIPFAYLICFVCIIEGVVIILEDPHLGLAGSFAKSENVYLKVLAWGDIVFAFMGIMGVWFSHNLLPVGWRHTSQVHSPIAKFGTGSILLWRTLVCLSFAPWAGILLAFSKPNDTRVWIWVLISAYIAVSIFFVFVLAMVFRQAVCDSKRFQDHLNRQALQERQQLLQNAYDHKSSGRRHCDGENMHEHEVEPELFFCFPLAETVAIYAAIILIASLWNFIHLCATGHNSGGWAFFVSTPAVSATFWLEVFLWPISFLIAVIGLAGAATLCGSGVLDEVKTSTSCLLVFLLGSMLRFALLFAITGMDLIEKNICGFYLNGLAKLAYKEYWSPASGLQLHCSGGEFFVVIMTLLCCLLDGYLIWGTFQLWHHAQDWKFAGEQRKGGYASLEDDSVKDL